MKLPPSLILVGVLAVASGCGGGGSGSRLPEQPPDDNTAEPGFLSITAPLDGTTLGTVPVEMTVTIGGSLEATAVTVTLIDENNVERNVTGSFSYRDAATYSTSLAGLGPGLHTLRASGTDGQGTVLSASNTFRIADTPDLQVPPKDVAVTPWPPVMSRPVDVDYVVVNRGAVAAPSSLAEVRCVPFLPGPPPVEVSPVTIPSLGSGERYPLRAAIQELDAPCQLIIDVDRDDLVAESDETNNSYQQGLDAQAPNEVDLAIRLLSFDYISSSSTSAQMRFLVEVVNVGPLAVQNPRLRYSIRERDTGNVIFAPPQTNGAGDCARNNDPGGFDTAVVTLPPLASGERARQTFTAALDKEVGAAAGSSGRFELCVATAASESADPAAWAPVIVEADQLGTNVVTVPWDMLAWERNAPVPAYPSDGEIQITGFTFDDTLGTDREPTAGQGDYALRLQLANLSETVVGQVSVRATYRGIKGVEGGLMQSTSWGGRRVLLRNGYRTQVELPLTGDRFFLAPFVEVQVEVARGMGGTDAEILLSETRVVPLIYKDVGIESIELAPQPPEAHPIPAGGGERLDVPVTMRQLGSEGVAASVTLSVVGGPPGTSPADWGTIANSPWSAIISANGTYTVPFKWAPAVSGPHTLRAEVTFTGEFQTPAAPLAMTPGTEWDESLNRTFEITPRPVTPVTDVSVLWAKPAERVLPVDTQTLEVLPLRFEVLAYDAAQQGGTFSVRVYDELEERDVVPTTTMGPVQPPYEWLRLDWTPRRAGYHSLVVYIDGEEKFRHRLALAPYLEFFDSFSGPVRHVAEYNWGHGQDGSLLLFTRADQLITSAVNPGEALGDLSRVKGVQARTFRVIDGTAEPNPYMVTLRMPAYWVGAMQTASLFLADTDYEFALVAGLRLNTEDGTFRCWELDLCANDFVTHEPLYKPDSGGSLLGVIAGALGEAVFNETTVLAAENAVRDSGRAVGRALATIGAVVEVTSVIHDVNTCDETIDEVGYVHISGPVLNGFGYDAFLMLDAIVKAVALAGDSYAYADFFDYFSSDCGGRRKGIRLQEPASYRLW